jgi:hypothetical protein
MGRRAQAKYAEGGSVQQKESAKRPIRLESSTELKVGQFLVSEPKELLSEEAEGEFEGLVEPGENTGQAKENRREDSI